MRMLCAYFERFLRSFYRRGPCAARKFFEVHYYAQ